MDGTSGYRAILLRRLSAAVFPPRLRGERMSGYDGRLVGRYGHGQRYLLRADDAGYRLRQLTGLVPLGGKRPEMTAGWVAARSAVLEWLISSATRRLAPQSRSKSRWCDLMRRQHQNERVATADSWRVGDRDDGTGARPIPRTRSRPRPALRRRNRV